MQMIPFTEETIIIMAKLCISVIACAVVLVVVHASSQAIRKLRFCKQYGIEKLPKSISIKVLKTGSNVNEYELHYPYWCRQKKDGTADRRYNGNYIIWPKSYFWVENNVLSSRRPTAILNTVKALRAAGVCVKMCAEEVKKRREIERKKQALSVEITLRQIVQRYSNHPFGFEQMCADLFEKMGYTCHVTSKTNDGGFDIFMQKGTETSIVECKCYGEKHRVGRPEIQKLVGANVVVKAKNLIFVTTSEFTPEARAYAGKSGVILVSGQRLMKMLQEYGNLQEEIYVQPEEWQLNQYDLRDYIPEDIYNIYLE